MLANINFPGQLQWRSHEYEGAKEAFGEIVEMPPHTPYDSTPDKMGAQAFRWFPPSENMGAVGYACMQTLRDNLHGNHINDARNYLYVHDKVSCFDKWYDAGIPIPNYKTWEPGTLVGNPYPVLLRLNNGVAGQDSWLVRTEDEFWDYLPIVEDACRVAKRNGRGVHTRLLMTRFIDTQHPDYPLNASYRIIVAGGKVVTGYARVSDPQDWVAVTNKFHSGIADAWLFYNHRCQQIMTEHEALIVQAVEVLGLNHQGVDIIEDGKTGQLYFLEVQTTYDAGFIGAGPYVPPYYNPYNPELVKFLKENDAMIAKELPLYHDAWLDKREHFRRCYKNLAQQFAAKA
jgi:hypothetical protein